MLTFDGAAELTLPMAAGGAVEARFAAAAKAVGRARVQMTARLGSETDSFEDVVPVEILASPETVAAYGQVGAEGSRASETLVIPASVVPGFGGLRVEMSSTAMVGLGEGARYLVEYPYGCAEQKGSRALAMLLAADLGDAFALPGVDTAKMKPAVQQALEGARAVPVSERRLHLLARSVPVDVRLPHQLPAARLQGRERSQVRRRPLDAAARVCLPGSRAGAASANQRELVARLYRLAGVRGQGDGRSRAQRGLPPHAPLRLPRSDAGLRAGLPARRAGGQRREERSADRRAAAADDATRCSPRPAARTSRS